MTMNFDSSEADTNAHPASTSVYFEPTSGITRSYPETCGKILNYDTEGYKSMDGNTEPGNRFNFVSCYMCVEPILNT